MFEIEDSGPKLTESDVATLELQLRNPLPGDYRRFLLEFNGGRPTPDTVDIAGDILNPLPKRNAYGLPGPTNVDTLFGLGNSMESRNLDWNLSTLSERLEQLKPIQEALLPIATDSGGSVFCLSLEGSKRGAILYCDLQSVFADYEAVPKLYFVAPSFTAFLEKLRPFI